MFVEELTNKILQTYTAFERIYKKRYQCLGDEKKLHDYVDSIPYRYIAENDLLLPEKLIPRFRKEGGEIYQNEPLVFQTTQEKILIEKHPRYMAEFWHNHAMFELLYMYRGNCHNAFEDTTYFLHEGEALLIAPRINHKVGVFDDSILLNIKLSPLLFHATFAHYRKGHEKFTDFLNSALQADAYHPYFAFLEQNAPAVRQLARAFYAEEYQRRAYMEDELLAYAGLFFTELLRSGGRQILAETTHNNLKKFGEISQVIQTNFRTVTLAGLADTFHYSAPYLSRLIHRYTGATFQHIVQTLRLVHAAEALRGTSQHVSEIAIDCGYQSDEHFIRLFKRNYGLTPLQYRKQHARQ